MSEFGFIEKYLEHVSCELAVLICVTAYATVNKSTVACKLISKYILYLSNDRDIALILQDKEIDQQQIDYPEPSFDEEWFEKQSEAVQFEIIQFVNKVREIVFKSSINIGFPLCLVMFKALQDCVGEVIYSKLPQGTNLNVEPSGHHRSYPLTPNSTEQSAPSDDPSFLKGAFDVKQHTSTKSDFRDEYTLFQQNRVQIGHQYFEEVYGKVTDKLLSSIHSFHPNLDYMILANGYGDVFCSGSVLTHSEVEIASIAAITLLNTPVQLYSHIRGALRVGTPRHVVDAAANLSKRIYDLIHS